jgi:hypothetical protein
MSSLHSTANPSSISSQISKASSMWKNNHAVKQCCISRERLPTCTFYQLMVTAMMKDARSSKGRCLMGTSREASGSASS